MKPSKFSQTAVTLLGIGLLLSASLAPAQTEPQLQWNQDYRTKYEVPIGTYTGRSPYMRSNMEAAVTAPAPEAESSWASVRIAKEMPSKVTQGMEFMTVLTVKAEGNAENVIVRDTLPEGVALLRSEPAGAPEGSQWVWRLGNVKPGAPVKITTWLRADKEGSLVNCATASVEPRTCTTVFVGKPMLVIEKTGPATVTLGSNVVYTITVKNTGTAPANDVVVVDPVPAGFSHSSGQPELSVNIGTLAPGQSKVLTATFRAGKRGQVCNVATVQSSNAGKISSQACTLVQQPGLRVEKTGTTQQIIGRNADYEVAVFNTGDMVLNNVTVVDTAPEGTQIAAAPEAAIVGNKATWVIPALQVGEKKSFNLKLTGKMAGSLCNTVTASAAGVSDSAKACTAWRGVAGILLEMVDDPDPIQVGENTTYTIRITNQGFADMHNVKTVLECDEFATPVSSEQGSVSGKSVSFPVASVIGPKATITYRVTIKGAKTGDSRNKVVITCDELRTPVSKEESTTIY
jgi:uncharacterized repeat protein (TIGR01451 family)